MTYGDSIEKQRGIAREPFVAQRILEYFKKGGMDVKMQQANLLEDMRKKYDYSYSCSERQSFAKTEKIHEIKVDIKTGKTFTLFDDLGRNTLENSESDFIVYEFFEGDGLWWINTGRFKACLDKHGYQLRKSKLNNSKYFFIEEYLRTHKKFMGDYAKYIK